MYWARICWLGEKENSWKQFGKIHRAVSCPHPFIFHSLHFFPWQSKSLSQFHSSLLLALPTKTKITLSYALDSCFQDHASLNTNWTILYSQSETSSVSYTRMGHRAKLFRPISTYLSRCISCYTLSDTLCFSHMILIHVPYFPDSSIHLIFLCWHPICEGLPSLWAHFKCYLLN